MTPYNVVQLNDAIVFIRWNRPPQGDEALELIHDLRVILDAAHGPVYFLSDLRQGRVEDAHLVREMARIASHRRYAAGVAFTEDPMGTLLSDVYAGYARKFNAATRNGTFRTLDAALDFLEHARRGVTQGIDWACVELGEVADPVA